MADVTMQYISHIKGWLASTRRRLTSIKGRQASRVERAQLLLITALALAVILVTVALLLNAAIFTENVATRDTTADGHEAIELRGELVDGIGELIERENHQEQGELERTDSIESSIDEMGPMVDRERARGGTIATLSQTELQEGKLVDSNIDAGGTDWVVAETITQIRAFSLAFDPNSLYENSAPNESQLQNNSFGVEFDSVTLFMYDDGDDVVLTEIDGAGNRETRCRITHNNRETTVDLTGDRLTTDESTVDCYRGLWPEDDPTDIEFTNADNTDGSFTLTVGESTSVPVADSDHAVYSVTVDIGYQSQDLTFETTARVAPGEPR